MTALHRLATTLVRSPLHPPLRWLAERLVRYMDVADNYNNCDFDSNGEGFLIRRGAPHWQVAFDVGANVGDWTSTVLAVNPRCVVHAFEPSPQTFDQLQTRLGSREGVTIHNAGVGASEGELSFYDHGPGSVLSSFVDRSGSVGLTAQRVIPVRVTSLDAFLDAQGIPRVDYVKLDTEGFEMPVFRGMSRALASRRVGTVQFEYGGTWLDQGETLRNAAALLSSHGYSLFRMLPEGLTAVRYDHRRDETFKYANFVAVADPSTLAQWGVPH